MHTVTRFGQNLPAVYDGNLNGIFDFLGRKVGQLCRAAGSFIAGKVKFLSLGLINTDFIENYFNGLAQKAVDAGIAMQTKYGRTAAPQDITDAEDAFITKFYNTQLQPFVGSLFDELKQATVITNQTAKLTALNAILNKINTVNDYYDVETESTTMLSESARQQRQYLIYEMLRTVNDGVKAAAAQMGITTTVQVTFSPGVYNFSPLFSGQPIAQVTGENYKAGATTVATLPTANPIKNAPVFQTGTDPRSILKDTTVGNIVKVTPTSVANATASGSTAPTTKKSNVAPIVIGAGILIGGYLLLKKKAKKTARPATKAKTK